MMFLCIRFNHWSIIRRHDIGTGNVTLAEVSISSFHAASLSFSPKLSTTLFSSRTILIQRGIGIGKFTSSGVKVDLQTTFNLIKQPDAFLFIRKLLSSNN